jgi:hypothetical protein
MQAILQSSKDKSDLEQSFNWTDPSSTPKNSPCLPKWTSHLSDFIQTHEYEARDTQSTPPGRRTAPLTDRYLASTNTDGPLPLLSCCTRAVNRLLER